MHWFALMRSTGDGYLRITQAIMLARAALNQIDRQQWFEGRSRKNQSLAIPPAMHNIAFCIADDRTAKMPAFHNIIAGNFNQS